MGSIKRALAFPFRLVALIFHLPTVRAKKITGNESEGSHQAVGLAIVTVLAIVAVPGWVAMRFPARDGSRFNTQTPMDFRGAIARFTDDEMVRVKPLIRITACVFAEKAVRHRLEPMQVGFPACGERDEVQTAIGDNLIDIVVSGVATVGKMDKPFRVTLQHYPPSTDEDGFLVTAIDVDTSGFPASEGAM
jgi:hypothetical protein